MIISGIASSNQGVKNNILKIFSNIAYQMYRNEDQYPHKMNRNGGGTNAEIIHIIAANK
jgi:hypothetical protein